MASSSLILPQELWWLVCQELVARRDFNSLFNCALVSKDFAAHALPLLYSIHELSSASMGESTTADKVKWAKMWRAIILSSTAETAYPYCLWIKALRLGDLDTLLQDVAPYPVFRTPFFAGAMESFELVSKTSKTRRGQPILEMQKIVEKIGDTITEFVKDAADRENKSVALTSLEGLFIPTPLLSLWTSRLATLSSLTLRDGSVLTGEVAEAIHVSCPAFKELVCFNILGSTVDEDLAAFILGLRPNSLETFSVLSTNQIGQESLGALQYHSSSLRELGLSNIQKEAFPHLNALSPCDSLEWLHLESSRDGMTSKWATESKDTFLEVASWLKSCSKLCRLEMFRVPGAGTLLADVLKSPELRLKSLELSLLDDDEAFYPALGNQIGLERFSFVSTDEFLQTATPRHFAFLNSVCNCRNLRELDLMQFSMSLADLVQVKDTLSKLEEFSFDGEMLSDEIWKALKQLPALKTLNINGLSAFSFEGILSFIQFLQSSPAHRGFRLYIMNQIGEAKLSDDEEVLLGGQMAAAAGPDGRLDLTYFRDPDEEMSEELSD
ncbi:hypothetical protein UCRPA7_3868 [Phaeoacremonium minimum UCRPA7]|uniref:F-box domain-containing protein n=1 Tax=Phaeoacremonium minimum (strain UCR-PA7) TaxID=1286976 RepID=R8BML9_PHAM7|nr:hypothetical protein UCRPA7_3868 [Phaeoacremonium minimum UCRPA7]EOO00638.1 hypothetical protein UCRPA7_3868 [Phaeoacremonium minimum UCRPA7]